METSEAIQLDVQVLAVLVGTVIPILVGLVTKLTASSGLKAFVNLFLSAVAAALAVVMESGGIIDDWKHWLTSTAVTFAVSVAVHYGFWKPVGVTGTSGVVQQKTAGIGLGGR